MNTVLDDNFCLLKNKCISANLRAHHRVEEDLEEVEMIFVSRLHDLDPLNFDCVLSALDFSLEFRYVAALAVRVETVSPLNVELDLLLDFVPDSFEDRASEFAGIVRDFRSELDDELE